MSVVPSSPYAVMAGAEAWNGVGATTHPERNAIAIGLIHGFTGSPISMRPLAEQLQARGFHVDVPRLPGHGTHHRDMLPTRYADWRAEVLRTLERLRGTSQRVFLVGLSMGGSLALDVGESEQGRLAGVVAINAQILSREGLLVKLSPLLEHIVPLAPAELAGLRKDDIAKPNVSERAYDKVPAAAGNSFLRELPRLRERLPSLRIPALVAYSRQDHNVPPENSKAILRLLSHSSATELVLERSYHVATLDYDLEVLVDAITDFCDRA